MPDITGAAALVDRTDKTYAPRNAPTAPGIAILPTTRQSTLFNRECEIPRRMLVPSSDKCTVADATAGLSRGSMVTNKVLAITP